MALDQLRVNRLWEAVRLTSHELVWELDPQGFIRFMNDAADQVLGIPAAEVVGRSVMSLIHPDDGPAARALLVDCCERRSGWDGMKVRALRADGATVWVESSGVAHVGPDGALVGFTATTRRLDADDARAVEQGVTRRRIERVIDEGLLSTVWQPIFSLDHGGVIGVEALSRFPDADGSGPDRWFAEAFDVGLGPTLEALAIGRALDAARRFPAHVQVAVNLSPPTVASAEFEAVMARSAIPLDRIVIELTEHVSIEDYEAVAARLTSLRRDGVRLAVDDAGAGFASFRHILELHPDTIKLDQSITRGISTNPAQRALATALVLFALEVGSMAVTAEGVESEGDLATVSSLGVDAAQGFYMSRPVPAAQIGWDVVVPESRSHRGTRRPGCHPGCAGEVRPAGP